MNHNTTKFSWEDIDKLTRLLYRNLEKDCFKPDTVIGVHRGGLIIAIHIAYLLETKNIGSVFVQTSSTDEVLGERPFEFARLDYPHTEIKNKNVLLIDTVMASGLTINLALKEINQFNPNRIKIGTLLNWPNSPYKLSWGKRPNSDYNSSITSNWSEFPWEV